MTMGDNHRRGIGTALKQLDQLLDEVAVHAVGHDREGVLFRETNRLQPSQRESLLREVAAMRRILAECRDQLALPIIAEDVSSRIWGRSSALWEVLVETTSRHLRRYGAVPEEVTRFLDPRVEELIGHLIAITEVVSRPG